MPVLVVGGVVTPLCVTPLCVTPLCVTPLFVRWCARDQPEVLLLSENRISESGFVHLQPHLRPGLLELDLSSNAIGVKGCTAVAFFLMSTGCKLRKVRRVDLGFNHHRHLSHPTCPRLPPSLASLV
jgi:hypothetical protein